MLQLPVHLWPVSRVRVGIRCFIILTVFLTLHCAIVYYLLLVSHNVYSWYSRLRNKVDAEDWPDITLDLESFECQELIDGEKGAIEVALNDSYQGMVASIKY